MGSSRSVSQLSSNILSVNFIATQAENVRILPLAEAEGRLVSRRTPLRGRRARDLLPSDGRHDA